MFTTCPPFWQLKELNIAKYFIGIHMIYTWFRITNIWHIYIKYILRIISDVFMILSQWSDQKRNCNYLNRINILHFHKSYQCKCCQRNAWSRTTLKTSITTIGLFIKCIYGFWPSRVWDTIPIVTWYKGSWLLSLFDWFWVVILNN